MEKEKRYFEWIDGEDKGSVVTLDYIDVDKDDNGNTVETYVFTNGDSCYKDFISPMVHYVGDLHKPNKDGSPSIPKFMIEVSSPTNVWTFSDVKGKTVDLGVVNGADSGKRNVPALEDILTFDKGGKMKTFNLVPPLKEVPIRPLPSLEDYRKVVAAPVVNVEVPKEEPVLEEPIKQPEISEHVCKENVVPSKPEMEDPVSILVSTSKKEEKEIEMRITLSLPSKDLFAIASNNFENGETKFIDNIVKDLDISDIISAIRTTLLESYKASVSEQ